MFFLLKKLSLINPFPPEAGSITSTNQIELQGNFPVTEYTAGQFNE